MTKVNNAVSDLFFNHQHSNYNMLQAEQQEDFQYDGEEAIAMLRHDAEAFLEMLTPIYPNDLTPADLVTDYFSRV